MKSLLFTMQILQESKPTISDINSDSPSNLEPWNSVDVVGFAIHLRQLTSMEGRIVYNPSIFLKLVDDDNNYNTSLITKIYEEDIVEAVKLALNSAKVYSDSCLSEIIVFDKDGNVIPDISGLKLDEIFNSMIHPVPANSTLWTTTFAIVVHKFVDEDTQKPKYTASVNLSGHGINFEKHEIGIVTNIWEDNIHDTAKEAFEIGKRMTSSFVDRIVVIDMETTKSIPYFLTISELAEEINGVAEYRTLH